jgi:hypothetical protein
LPSTPYLRFSLNSNHLLHLTMPGFVTFQYMNPCYVSMAKCICAFGIRKLILLSMHQILCYSSNYRIAHNRAYRITNQRFVL